jgi:photosystem II stability/assembly factor-like uncharacterized protein
MGLAMDTWHPDTVYFSTSGHIYATNDGGHDWLVRYTRPLALGTPPPTLPWPVGGWWSGTGLETTCLNSIAVHPTDPQHLYFCYMDVGLIQSADGGRLFAQTNQGMRYRGNTFTVVFDPINPLIVYAGTGEWGSNHGDVCKSFDGGFTWRVVGHPKSGLPDGQTYHLVVDPAGTAQARRLYVTVAGAGLYASDDSAETWRASGNGLPGNAIADLGLVPGTGTLLVLLPGQQGSAGGLYCSNNRARSWQRLGQQTWADPKALAVSASDPLRLYVAARDKGTSDGEFSPGGVYASRDGGQTWAHVLKDPFIQAVAVDPSNADIVYAGGMDHPFHDDALGSGVQYSRDGGKTWQSLNDNSLTVRKIQTITLDTHHPALLYVGSSGNGVFVRELPAK